jgi:transketolase
MGWRIYLDQKKLDALCINTIRMLAIDAVEAANSGHPGMPMEAADLAYVLWTKFLNYNPANPNWPNRDRFVLSAGHGSMLLYSLLYLTGYDLSLDEIKNFRQWKSRTPGHPEFGLVPGVETTTGPLGQGFAAGVGMAMAESYLAQNFNRPDYPIIDYHIYAFVSDGDMMEGISSEAASLAGHLGLGKLVYIYLDNHITIDGSTTLAFSDDVAKRFESYKWQVQKVDGYDIQGISKAIQSARSEIHCPSLVIARTHIGYGSPNKQDKESSHGSPLGADEVRLVKEKFKWPLEPSFYVPEEALTHFRKSLEKGERKEKEWETLLTNYSREYPDLADKWNMAQNKKWPDNWEKDIPAFDVSSGPIATRSASGKVLNAVAPKLFGLFGGSADLTHSNNTYVKDFDAFHEKTPGGKNIYFGVREHAMAGILSGLALSSPLIPYAGTFLVFSDYMRPSLRLAAMMRLHVIYIFTHDSIGVGEDGPTHQPIEQLANLRAIPHLTVIRPADASDTAEAWKVSLNHKDGPVALILTRQKVPVIDRSRFASAENLARGGYVLADPPSGNPDIILLATGSEVHPTLAAYGELTTQGFAVRVVNMASWELFEKQEDSYKDRVLLPAVTKRLAIEAASPQGWHRYVGLKGDIIGMTGFGASAPGSTLFEKFGFNIDNIVERAKSLLSQNSVHR